MQNSIKIGAGILLLLIVAPVLLTLSRNADLVLPIWLLISYAMARRLLPVARRWLAVPTALVCGQLAFRLLQATIAGVIPLFALSFAALAVALAWLLLTGSRWAVGAVVVAEVAMLALEAPAVPRVVEQVRGQPFDFLPFVVAAYIAPLAAIGLVLPGLKPPPRPDPRLEVFD